MSLIQTLDQRWYPGIEDQWDGRPCRARGLEQITPQTRMLDMEGGRRATEILCFKNLVAELIGTDIAPAVLQNPDVDRAVHTPDGSLKGVEDGYFDVVVSKNVLEHVKDLGQFFCEVARVLKLGGVFMPVTPKAAHYVPLIARRTALSFYKVINKLRGRETVDTFPTHYRANSASTLKYCPAQVGLEFVAIGCQGDKPEYLRLHPVLYVGGMLYERTINRLGSTLRAVAYVTMQKPSREFGL